MKILMEYKDNSVFIGVTELNEQENDNYMVIIVPPNASAINQCDCSEKTFTSKKDAKLAFIELIEAHIQGIRKQIGEK